MDFLDQEEQVKEKSKPLDINIIRKTLTENGYALLRPIGKGGFGSVFLVFSNQYSIEFVVKVSDYKGSFKADSPNSGELDFNEINNLINLIHPNIINMYKYFTDDHYLYIVLEYCEGGSLKDLLSSQGRIRPPLLFNYCHQILTALKHCHDIQIAHGDLKPANVLIDKNQRLKLADFGLSKGFNRKFCSTVDADDTTDNDHSVGKNGEILIKEFDGSIPYMPPELLQMQPYDPFKADVWSLGVTFYQLATGHLPWNYKNPKEMRMSINYGAFSFPNIKLPSSFCSILHKMIEVIPAKRATIDWLIEQPIFNQLPSVPAKKSILSKSPSIGSQMSFKLNTGIKERNMKLSSCKNKSFVNMLTYATNISTASSGESGSDGATKASASDNLDMILEEPETNQPRSDLIIMHESPPLRHIDHKRTRKIKPSRSNGSVFPAIKTFM